MYPAEGLRILTQENQSACSSQSSLLLAKERQAILEARAVMCDNAHNLFVDLGCMRGMIPRCEGAIGIAEGTVRDIAILSRVGRPVCFLVENITTDAENRPLAILSRRAAQEQCRDTYLKRLTPGDIVPVKITHFENYGCFVDIGCGISALMPIDSISVSRIAHPSDRFTLGQDILAVVRQIDETGRITLSHKELLGNWAENAAMFKAGETVSGIVRSIEQYGIFIELTPNLAGLAECRPNVSIGQQASVYIKSLIPDRMKVKLNIVDTFPAPSKPAKLRYFITSGHLDEWRYSPDGSDKLIETRFG